MSIILYIGFFVLGVICVRLFMWKKVNKQTIDDIMNNIVDSLDKADAYEYDVIFRTPECVAYKNCHLHVATTKNCKEIIIVDVIGEKEHIKLFK